MRYRNEKRFDFWQKWLLYSSLLFAAFGIVLAVYGDAALFRPYFSLLARTFWQQETFPPGADGFRALASGPLGGTIACAYILLAFLAAHPFRKRERWARNAIIVAFGTWFIVDTTICLYYQIWIQALGINLFSFLQKALPLAFTWNDFKHRPAPLVNR